LALRDLARRTFRGIWDSVLAADRFLRLHLLFFTALWLLLGAASIARNISARELGALLGVAVCFHVYAYVLNDVVDLPLDRTQPARQRDPLVRGVVRPWQALVVALVQPLLTILLTISLGADWSAHAALTAGFALMGAYNIWGKRCPLPPLTDAIQGLAWGCLALYAAYALNGRPNALTWMVVGYATVLIMFINGIHGGLRDLENDLARGVRTTAIYLGARPAAAGGALQIPAPLTGYAWLILALLIAMNVALMVRNDFQYGRLVWMATAVVVGVLNVAAALLQPKVLKPRGSDSDIAWRLQMYLMSLSLPLAFVAYTRIELLAAFVFLNAIALLLWDTTAVVTRWTWLKLRTAIDVAQKGLADVRTD
jgi:4-hydroxybenzoate polyprenyltransferase